MRSFVYVLLISCLLSLAKSVSVHEIRVFEETLDGKIVLPGDRKYKSEKAVWSNQRRGSSPSAIVLPASYQDVQKVVEFARVHKLHPRVKSGGHSFAGWGQKDNEWVISMKQLKVLERTRVREGCRQGLSSCEAIRVGAGLRFRAVYQHLEGTGLLFPGGTCPTVGVGGFFLGGGHSPIGRLYGMSSDSILSMQIVTADGKLRTVSRTENADLYWALTGSGHGNFGYVVEFTVQLYRSKQHDITYGQFTWSPRKAGDIKSALKEWIKFMPIAPRESAFQVHSFPLFFKIQFNHFGSHEEARSMISKLQSVFPKPRKLTVKYGSQAKYVDTNNLMLNHEINPMRAYLKTGLYADLTPAYVDTLVDAYSTWQKPKYLLKGIPAFVITALGGAYKDSNAASSAYHRSAGYVTELAGSWRGKKNDRKWMTKLQHLKDELDTKAPHIGPYVNYADERLENWEAALYGTNAPRLKSIKRKYDPSGMLQYENGVSN